MRRFAVLLALPLLAGCSSVNDMLSFPGGSSSQTVASAAPATPAPATPAATSAAAPDPFCLGVAKGDATGNDFDAATQTRVAQRSYAQCVAIFGNAQ